MKKFISIMMCLAVSASLFTACGKKEFQESEKVSDTTAVSAGTTVPVTTEKTEPEIMPVKKSDQLKKKKTEEADVDLCTDNSVNNYNTLLKILISPDDYNGKTVKMHGTFSISKNRGKNYYICTLSSGNGPNSQSLEFTLSKDYKYPDDFPAVDEEITIFGKLHTLNEGENKYCQIKDAVFTD